MELKDFNDSLFLSQYAKERERERERDRNSCQLPFSIYNQPISWNEWPRPLQILKVDLNNPPAASHTKPNSVCRNNNIEKMSYHMVYKYWLSTRVRLSGEPITYNTHTSTDMALYCNLFFYCVFYTTSIPYSSFSDWIFLRDTSFSICLI